MSHFFRRLALLALLCLFAAPSFAMGTATEKSVPAVQPSAPSVSPSDHAPQLARMEEELLRRINQERLERGVEPLSANADLARVARAFSRRMNEEGFFSHVDPAGGTMADRLRDAGIRYRMAGENISMSVNAPDPVGVAVNGWMKSPGHRENILRPDYTETGIGIWREGETYHFTQIFMRPF